MVKPISKSYDPRSWRERFQHAEWEMLPQLQEAYDEAVDDHERAQISARFSDILYDIRIGNSFRSSGRGRLSVSERLFVEHLNLADSGPTRIIDIGASDGSTTEELTAVLEKAGAGQLAAVAADRDLMLAVYAWGAWREYRTSRNVPVFARRHGFGQRLTMAGRGWNVFSKLISYIYLRLPWRQKMLACGEIPLIQPGIAVAPTISTMAMDIFSPPNDLQAQFHAVRICNLLNREVFTVQQIEQAALSAAGLLRDGGLLLIARNHGRAGGEDQRGSLWRLRSRKLEVIDRYGGGSEIEDLIPGQIDPRQAATTGIAP